MSRCAEVCFQVRMFASHDALENLGSDVVPMTLDVFNELYDINGRYVTDNIIFE